MRLAYLDASAAMKLIVDEAESESLAQGLAAGRRLVASWLLSTELHCAAGRHPREVPEASVLAVLSVVNLVDLLRIDFIEAGRRAPLRSNDALHLAAALRIGAHEMVTYDVELAAAAEAAGLEVFAPSGA